MIGSERAVMVVAVVATTMALAGEAFADPRKAAAEALFREGKKLMAAKDFQGACPKLEESYKIDPAEGTLLNLGLCHESLGKTATAWSELKEARSLARSSGHVDRERIADQHATAIEHELARVTVKLAPGADVPSLEVKLDGVAMGRGAFETAIPVDPGDHAVEASAPNRKGWSSSVTVKRAEQRDVVVPELAHEVIVKPPPPVAQGGGWKRPVGVAALGVGALGLSIGVFAGARAVSLGNESAAACPNDRCSPEGYAAFQDGRANARTADFMLPIGVIATAAAVYLLATSSPPRVTAAARSGVIRLEW